MRILHTADWHLGTFRSPVKGGVNLRTEDTRRCLDELVRVAREEVPDYTLISGDVFDAGKSWSDRCCPEVVMAAQYIKDLAEVSRHVIVMRGTPNHDGDVIGQFNVLSEMFGGRQNVHVVATPQVVKFEDVDVAVLPGFDKGVYRAGNPGLSNEEENEEVTKELSNIVLGLKAQCSPSKRSILMAHYTVPGCNMESGQTTMLARFEPVIPQEALLAAGFDLVALGHIHRPQRISPTQNWFYAGAINQINFNDEGQERGFWIHEADPAGGWKSTFHATPAREHVTIKLQDEDVTAINLGGIDGVALEHWRLDGAVAGKIARVRYSCSEDNAQALKLNEARLAKALLDDGAFMVWDILPDKVEEYANRKEAAGTADPEENLIKYLEEKEVPPEKVQELVLRARPIIAEAEAGMPTAANTGAFEPVEISVHNYRNYEDETFNFEPVTFCTINGQNGAGKSSLFMDAILDCLYEEPREGVIKDDSGKPPWLRNDVSARSGSIMFTFKVGEKQYRVTRTRTRSGRGTLNIACLIGSEWEDCSKERSADTQQEILDIIGMDSLTFRSCALIMQDQYGLFLQAKPEERMEVLGRLLGLGIYQAMEGIAQDKSKEGRDKAKAVKQEVDIKSGTIASLGDPDGELEACRAGLELDKEALRAASAELDRDKALLSSCQEASNRRGKLLASITALQAKKAATGQNRDIQREIIDGCDALLAERGKAEAKVAEYHSQVEMEGRLARESALYSAKKEEAESLTRQAEAEQASIDGIKRKAQQKERELESLQPTGQDAVVKEKAEEYGRYVGLLEKERELQARHAAAMAERDRIAYAIHSKKAYMDQGKRSLDARKADMERRTELLGDSGCPDPEHAECRFLADALEAKKGLPALEGEIAAFVRGQGAELEGLEKALEEAEKKALEIGYNEERLQECQRMARELSVYPAALKRIEEREGKAAIIQADLGNLRSNMLEAEKRLEAAKAKLREAEMERDKHAGAHEEHARVQRSILELKPWLEKERQIAVAEERERTAASRILELTRELEAIDAEIEEKQGEADREALAMAGMEDLAWNASRLEAEVQAASGRVMAKQVQIGALQQKSEQLAKLKSEVSGLLERQAAYAKETAEYDALKAAFSQSGVPHQVIRSIIPHLTATSNSILGQMTGGKMGVEFRLERTQKNGKEKPSLDIYIEEYGKPALPYLSKSGGEKVKSSLSVILALAETKSSSAGIQLGMLFVDEPPFLDGDGVQAYCDALEAIQGRYRGIKVMAITHDPTMKARFPQNLDVIKTENGSKVVFR